MDKFCYNIKNNIYINSSFLHPDMLDDNLKIYLVKVLKNSLDEDKQFDIFVDLNGLTMGSVNTEFMAEMIQIFSTLFPNRLRKCEIRNYPSFFKSVYNLLKNYIDKVTRDKIFWVKKPNMKDIDDIYSTVS